MKTIDQVDVAKLKEACNSFNSFLEKNEIEGATKIRTTGVKNEKVLEAFVGSIRAVAKAERGKDLPEDVILVSNDIFSTPTEEGKTEETKEKEPEKKKPAKPDVPKSRYGHKVGSQAAKLDDLLFKGTTIKDAAAACDTKETRVKSHILHLQKEKGLTIDETEGVYKVAQ